MLSGTLFLCVYLAGCARGGGPPPPRDLAETITRAIYANDFETTVAAFDDATKRAVTRSELGTLSDRMHALGTLRSIVARDANVDMGRYEFDAAFTGGTLLVQMRIDPSGKVGAFRVVDAETATPPPPLTHG